MKYRVQHHFRETGNTYYVASRRLPDTTPGGNYRRTSDPDKAYLFSIRKAAERAALDLHYGEVSIVEVPA